MGSADDAAQITDSATMKRIALAYLLAVAVTYVLGAVLATQSVLSSLAGMGVDVSAADRVGTTAHDLLGMLPAYAPIIALALALALPCAALLTRVLPRWRHALYPLAGAVGIIAAHIIMRLLLEVTVIASTRTLDGLLLQGGAGALGAWSFSLLLTKMRSRSAGT
jgi:hypothetical protein